MEEQISYKRSYASRARKSKEQMLYYLYVLTHDRDRSQSTLPRAVRVQLANRVLLRVRGAYMYICTLILL
jgi:hypothetical protein